mmetsp:Transcript_1224/g.3776  ORF Transcript_1224/g.3776 Transcript_1224/m.3776 type:complete len:772 (-) Transcript_1224:187-2502(-)
MEARIERVRRVMSNMRYGKVELDVKRGLFEYGSMMKDTGETVPYSDSFEETLGDGFAREKRASEAYDRPSDDEEISKILDKFDKALKDVRNLGPPILPIQCGLTEPVDEVQREEFTSPEVASVMKKLDQQLPNPITPRLPPLKRPTKSSKPKPDLGAAIRPAEDRTNDALALGATAQIPGSPREAVKSRTRKPAADYAKKSVKRARENTDERPREAADSISGTKKSPFPQTKLPNQKLGVVEDDEEDGELPEAKENANDKILYAPTAVAAEPRTETAVDERRRSISPPIKQAKRPRQEICSPRKESISNERIDRRDHDRLANGSAKHTKRNENGRESFERNGWNNSVDRSADARHFNTLHRTNSPKFARDSYDGRSGYRDRHSAIDRDDYELNRSGDRRRERSGSYSRERSADRTGSRYEERDNTNRFDRRERSRNDRYSERRRDQSFEREGRPFDEWKPEAKYSDERRIELRPGDERMSSQSSLRGSVRSRDVSLERIDERRQETALEKSDLLYPSKAEAGPPEVESVGVHVDRKVGGRAEEKEEVQKAYSATDRMSRPEGRAKGGDTNVGSNGDKHKRRPRHDVVNRDFRKLKQKMQTTLEKKEDVNLFRDLARQTTVTCFNVGLTIENDAKRGFLEKREAAQNSKNYYRYLEQKLTKVIAEGMRSFGVEDRDSFYDATKAKAHMRQMALDIAFNTDRRAECNQLLQKLGRRSRGSSSREDHEGDRNVTFSRAEAAQLKLILDNYKDAVEKLEVVMASDQEAGAECKVS